MCFGVLNNSVCLTVKLQASNWQWRWLLSRYWVGTIDSMSRLEHLLFWMKNVPGRLVCLNTCTYAGLDIWISPEYLDQCMQALSFYTFLYSLLHPAGVMWQATPVSFCCGVSRHRILPSWCTILSKSISIKQILPPLIFSLWGILLLKHKKRKHPTNLVWYYQRWTPFHGGLGTYFLQIKAITMAKIKGAIYFEIIVTKSVAYLLTQEDFLIAEGNFVWLFGLQSPCINQSFGITMMVFDFKTVRHVFLGLTVSDL